jgi:hypothetical protein
MQRSKVVQDAIDHIHSRGGRFLRKHQLDGTVSHISFYDSIIFANIKMNTATNPNISETSSNIVNFFVYLVHLFFFSVDSNEARSCAGEST